MWLQRFMQQDKPRAQQLEQRRGAADARTTPVQQLAPPNRAVGQYRLPHQPHAAAARAAPSKPRPSAVHASPSPDRSSRNHTPQSPPQLSVPASDSSLVLADLPMKPSPKREPKRRAFSSGSGVPQLKLENCELWFRYIAERQR